MWKQVPFDTVSISAQTLYLSVSKAMDGEILHIQVWTRSNSSILTSYISQNLFS